MKVCYLPSDMDAPGCYRCLFPGRQLQKLGGHRVVMPRFTQTEVKDGRYMVNFQLSVNPPDPMADIYVLQQRKERMWAEGGVMDLRRHGVVTVADLDDNYLELPEWNPAFYGTHPYRRDDGLIVNRSQRRKLKGKLPFEIKTNRHNREHMNNMLRQVDAVSVSTPYLADLYSRFNKNITVIRNYLDWDIWADVEPQCEVERERTRIGYLGVFTYRQGDLDVIKGVIPRFMRAHPEVDFVANTEEIHDYLGVPVEQRITIGEYFFRPPDDGEYPVGEKTAVLDIGLVPLALNGLNQGKSHLKGMEYNAAGIPFIASPTESYVDYWCEEGKNGHIAYTQSDWRELLEYMVSEDLARRQMGRRAREKASQHTYQQHWPEWESFYEEVMGGKERNFARQAIVHGAVQKVSELGGFLEFLAGRSLRVVVEVGSARGGTFWAFAQMAEDDALVVSIDIPAGSPLDVRRGKDVYGNRDRERMRTFGKKAQQVVLIDANSQLESTRDELLEVLNTMKIDLLFIDADHRYEGVKRDYELYAPLVREGGVIAFHDILVQKQDLRSRVHVLWDELCREHKQTHEFLGHETWGYAHQWGGIGAIIKS